MANETNEADDAKFNEADKAIVIYLANEADMANELDKLDEANMANEVNEAKADETNVSNRAN